MPAPTKPAPPALLADRPPIAAPPETPWPTLGLEIEIAGECLTEVYAALLADRPVSPSLILNTLEALLKIENELFELLP